jgi:UDP-glucose 4-epimerase
VLFVAAADSFMPNPSPELVREFYPATVIREEFSGNASLLSGAKAARLLGFRPEHSWRDYENANDARKERQ